MKEWLEQGSHRLYRDGDLLYFEVHGPFTLADAERMFAESEAIEQECGYVLSAFDNRDGPGMTAEARRYTSLKSREREILSATAIIGASLAVRTMTLLLINVARMVGKPLAPLLFCSTNSEATDWLAAQRKELQRRLAAKQADQP